MTFDHDPADQGYVPVDQWPDVTKMIDGFGDPSLPASEALVGKELEIRFDNGWTISHAFTDKTITWKIVIGEGRGEVGSHPYRAVEVRRGIFFVDFVKGEGAHSANVSMLINVDDGVVTAAESSFVDRDGAVRMSTQFLHGRIGQGEIEPRQSTTALVGKRIFYRYSDVEHYEHIYLNSGTFVWHCVRGGEEGLADTDPVHMFAVSDDLVLLHWSEQVMPVESFVAIDLKQQKSIGRMFCWDGPTLAPVRIPFDSRFSVLSEIEYPKV